MALLIILLERKNEILKKLSQISCDRQVLIKKQQMLEQAIKQQIQLSQSSGCPQSENRDLAQHQESYKANIENQKQWQEVYSWLYTQLEYTNRAIAPILTAFRFRSIKSRRIWYVRT